MHSFPSLYNENTVISKEYTGPLYFDITGVDCIFNTHKKCYKHSMKTPKACTEIRQNTRENAEENAKMPKHALKS